MDYFPVILVLFGSGISALSGLSVLSDFNIKPVDIGMIVFSFILSLVFVAIGIAMSIDIYKQKH
ncbi:hypothetical protein AVR82_08655 [Lactiplantibacillus plantarum]|uniref:hypothetical protein n=1 Tax=Lactiplantibacillus plantarum TaxID=1590 RepID=UPI00081C3DD5|nr:hypothetical protein [Lactiplantibacillus plantarum]AOB19690.1 hypothetical protein AVR82_08655 [Lactiplantibacillus plantarum]AOB23350.1 hypothetical protein AVR83_10470 [Lactiplantibacillus plantarum]